MGMMGTIQRRRGRPAAQLTGRLLHLKVKPDDSDQVNRQNSKQAKVSPQRLLTVYERS
jgi:hypothetical protein